MIAKKIVTGLVVPTAYEETEHIYKNVLQKTFSKKNILQYNYLGVNIITVQENHIGTTAYQL